MVNSVFCGIKLISLIITPIVCDILFPILSSVPVPGNWIHPHFRLMYCLFFILKLLHVSVIYRISWTLILVYLGTAW